MKHFTDFRLIGNDIKNPQLMERFADWSEELTDLLERRVFGGQFKELMDFTLSFSGGMVSRLTDAQVDEQLVVCSQHRATFKVLASELKLYLDKIEREYESWVAPRMIKAKEDILNEAHSNFIDGKITKSNVTVTKEEVRNRFLKDNFEENEEWFMFMDKIKRARSLVATIADDMKDRSIILMNRNNNSNSNEY